MYRATQPTSASLANKIEPQAPLHAPIDLLIQQPPTVASTVKTASLGPMKPRIDFMATHLLGQHTAYLQAEKQTAQIFSELLDAMEQAVLQFQQALALRDMPMHRVFARIDADRSVGVFNILWHTISFTIRGNIRPMAYKRPGEDPVFTGRIIALIGDYNELAVQSEDNASLYQNELASLYIPAGETTPSVMHLRHNGEELCFAPAEAAQQFLLKTLECVCAGGYFHESTQ